jgi:hypothetical protein
VSGIKFRISLVVLGAALLAAAPIAVPRTYKWVDDEGTTHYSQVKPPNRDAEELSLKSAWTSALANDDSDCTSLGCRAARLESERQERERSAQEQRHQAARAAAAYPVFPTPVKETDDEKIARLVAACESSRGSKCDSDAEKRRMLLHNVELSHAERRALRALSPARQRRALLQRIPKQYRNVD